MYVMVSVEFVQRAVAHHFGISLSELKSRRRDVIYSHPRMIAVYMCRVHLKMSFPKIARAFERDNCTVQHAFARVVGIIDTNDAFIDEHLEPINAVIKKVMSYA